MARATLLLLTGLLTPLVWAHAHAQDWNVQIVDDAGNVGYKRFRRLP